MTTIRIPDLIGAVNQFRTSIYPDYKEVLQAAEELFARSAICINVSISNPYLMIYSYNIMSPTRSKAFLNALKPGLLGALVYPLSDKKSIRLAIDQFILIFAYDDPFDEDALRLDDGAATKFSNTIVSAFIDTESFQPTPNFPVITAYHEYVFSKNSQSRLLLREGAMKSKKVSFLTRARFYRFFIAFWSVFRPSRRRVHTSDMCTKWSSLSYL